MAFNKDNFDSIMSRLKNIKIQSTDIFLRFREEIVHKTSTATVFMNNHREAVLKALIPAVIIVAGFYACSTSQEKIERNMKDIFELSKEIRSYYADKPDYWRLSTKYLIASNILSQRYIHGNKIILDGGLNVLVGSGEKAETVMPRVSTFDIVAPGLNKAQCISYAERILSKEELVVVEQITIVNSSGTYLFSWGGENPLPVKKYASKSFCADTGNTIIWSIK